MYVNLGLLSMSSIPNFNTCRIFLDVKTYKSLNKATTCRLHKFQYDVQFQYFKVTLKLCMNNINLQFI